MDDALNVSVYLHFVANKICFTLDSLLSGKL